MTASPRSTADARARHLELVQRAITCINRTTVMYAGRTPIVDGVEVTTVDSRGGHIQLQTRPSRGPLWVRLQQRLTFVSSSRRGQSADLRLQLLAYRYAVYADPEAEPLVYWHRDAALAQAPHLHAPLADPAGRATRLHVPCGPADVRLEDVLRFLLDELGVTPQRDDWDGCLRETLAEAARYVVPYEPPSTRKP